MDIAAIAVQMRTWKIQLAKELKKVKTRATYSEILEMAERICPTYLHFGGGQLFLSWFIENGKLSIRQWADTEENWSEELRRLIRKEEVPRWIFHILSSLNGISQKNTAQLFYPTLALDFKGLSRTGMNIQAATGAALQAKQYDRMKAEVVQQEKRVSLQILHEKSAVIWVDNFSKIYRNIQYRSQYGAYRDANYTAMAFLYNTEHVVDMSYMYLPNGGLVPGSSTVMLSAPFLNRCKQSYEKYNNYTQVYFSHSPLPSLLQLIYHTSSSILQRMQRAQTRVQRFRHCTIPRQRVALHL